MYNYKPVTLVKDYGMLPDTPAYREFQKDWRPIGLPNIYVLYSKTRDYVVVLDTSTERVAVMAISPKDFNHYIRRNQSLPDMGVWFTNLNDTWTMYDIVELVEKTESGHS